MQIKCIITLSLLIKNYLLINKNYLKKSKNRGKNRAFYLLKTYNLYLIYMRKVLHIFMRKRYKSVEFLFVILYNKFIC